MTDEEFDKLDAAGKWAQVAKEYKQLSIDSARTMRWIVVCLLSSVSVALIVALIRASLSK